MFSYTFYKYSVFFHFNKCKIYFDIELQSVSSSLKKSPKLIEIHALIKQTSLLIRYAIAAHKHLGSIVVSVRTQT